MKQLLIALAMMACIGSKAQDYKIINNWVIGSQRANVLIYWPKGMDTTQKLPGFVLQLGAGEVGTDTNQMFKNRDIGFGWWLKNTSWRPPYWLIIIQSPSSNAGASYTRLYMNALLRGTKPVCNMDSTRWFPVGYSYGAASWYNYLVDPGLGITEPKPNAGIFMSYEYPTNNASLDQYWFSTKPALGIGNLCDGPHGNGIIAAWNSFFTRYPNTGKLLLQYTGTPCHGQWGTWFDPNNTTAQFKDGSGNTLFTGSIYDWALQQAPLAGAPLVANAGVDKSITLPTSSVVLSGSGTGKPIASYAWSQVSGPNAASCSGCGTSTPTLSGLIQGTYVYKLTVTATDASTANDNINIIVNAATNQPPVAKVNVDINTGLNSQAMLDGRASLDPDGTIASYQWLKLTGPTGDTMLYSNQSVCLVGKLATAGIYTYQLKVTDNSGNTSTANINIIVAAAPTIFRAPAGTLILKTVGNEYSKNYACSDKKVYAYVWTSGKSETVGVYGIMSPWSDIGGGQYDGPVIDSLGMLYWIPPGTYPKVAKWVMYDINGNIFDKNVRVRGYLHQWLTIRQDGTLWSWGYDNWKQFGTNVGIEYPARPMQMPAGVQFKDVDVSENCITALATNGDVWQYNIGNTTPIKINLPLPAIGIASGRKNFYMAIVPQTGQPNTSGHPYCWGNMSYFGGTGITTIPQDMYSTWNLSRPIRDAAFDDESVHFIDTASHLWGMGNNDYGGVGIGSEWLNHEEIVGSTLWYVYDWANPPHIMITRPVDISNLIGHTVKKVFAGKIYAFGNDVILDNDSLAYTGRNKGGVSGNGILAGNEAVLPNYGDLLKPTIVSPLWAGFNQKTVVPGVISLGNDQSVTGNTASFTVNCTPTTFYNTISYDVEILSGGAYTLPNPHVTTTANTFTWNLSNLQQGRYILKVKQTDNNTATMADTLIIDVTSAPNIAPVVSSPANQTITAPQDSVRITWTATDGDGTVVAMAITQLSGPSSAIISNPNSTSGSITSDFKGLVPGIYIFHCTATDDDGSIGFDDVVVQVNENDALKNMIIRIFRGMKLIIQ